MCSRGPVRWGIIIILQAFIMQFPQFLLSEVTDAANNRHYNWIIGFCCRLGNYLLLELTLAWAKTDLFLEGKIIRKIYVFCICVGVTCSSAMLSRSIGGRPGWQKLGGASVQACVEWSSCSAITPSLFCLPLPFCTKEQKKKKKIVQGEGPLGKNIRHDRATVTGRSFTTPSM